MALCRYEPRPGAEGSWGWLESGRILPVSDAAVEGCLIAPGPEGLLPLASVATDGAPTGSPLEVPQAFLPPVHAAQEVWAAGVTYESSKFARMSESADGGDFYAKVYVADRPELFLKATPSRCVGQGGELRIRKDSTWNVPEPELAALISANGKVLGYTIGNDMSSRSIEGENPLYLPQAKVYRQCCGLGPVIVPAQSLDARNLPIRLTITRAGETAFYGETNTSRMRRTVEELVEWLFREDEFPHGVVMLTGTGLIPPDDFTLMAGDEIAIEIEGIGTLRNRIVQ